MPRSYTVEYTTDETGIVQAKVPAIEGCHTQAATIEEARTRIREAMRLYIEDAETVVLLDENPVSDDGMPPPVDTSDD